MLPRLALTFALAALVCPPALNAQSTTPDSDGTAPAHVSHVDGTVSLEREGRAENAPLNMPLLSGDRLRTVDGRVEVLFADGSTLHLDARSTIDVQSDDLIRLTEGRLRLNILGPQRAVAYRIDSPAGSARITQPGEYRIALLRGTGETQLEVAVVRGGAEVFTDQGATPVRAGERAYASAGLMPSYAYAYNSASQDAFDRWSEARRDVRLGVSSQYLPPDMQAYAPVLDQSGDWRQTESYGYAWYPRVAPDWRPYFYGRWDSYPRYGWTWIGADRFAWPTHHYGRWGFSAGRWFWIHSSRWAPAYVSWAYAPGYVSWCPLGFDNRPIFSINIFRTGHSPWRGWTVLSASHFGGRGYFVHHRAVNWDRFGGRRPRFEQRPSAPGFRRDIAVPRNSTPIRWAGSREVAGSRTSSDRGREMGGSRAAPTSVGRSADTAVPRYVNRGDEIVRSQTERPTPRAESRATRPEAGGYAIPRQSGPSTDSGPPRAESRGGGAEIRPFERNGAAPRTMPDGAARPSRSESTPFDPSTSSGSPRARSRDDVGAGRPFYGGQTRPVEGAQAMPRVSGGTPSYEPYQPRGYQPRAAAPPREDAPRAFERQRPSEAQAFDPPRASGASRPEPRDDGAQPRPYVGGAGRPMPERYSPRAAPVERAPSRGEGRQPPAERAGPPPRSAPSGGGGVAVPRRGRGGL